MDFAIVKSEFRELWQLILAWFNYRRFALKVELAMKVADWKQKALNKQITVILNRDRKFEWWTEKDFKQAKREKRIPKQWGMLDLAQITFYRTPVNRNNKLSKDERKKFKEKYLKYMIRNK